MENLILSFNVVLPLCLCIALGYFLYRIHMIEESTQKNMNRLVFRVFLPTYVFNSIYTTDIAKVFDLRLVGLTVFVKYSKTGRAMVAVSEDRDAALLMGINTNAIIAVTFAIGSALAAVACYLMLAKGSSVTATFGAMPGIKAFTAAVIGGIGSIPGAMLGGILLGVVESISLSIPALAPYTDAVEFAILIVILLVKPAGLLGKMRREKV